MTRRLRAVGIVLALAILASGCAAGSAFRQGERASRAGNLDEAYLDQWAGELNVSDLLAKARADAVI